MADMVAERWGGVSYKRESWSDSGEDTMRVLGLKLSKNKVVWSLVEGPSRVDAKVVTHGATSAPQGDRGAELVWLRQELLELLDKHSPDLVAIRVADPGGQGNSLPRAEAEGVAQEAIASTGSEVRRFYAATVRASFSVKNAADLDAALKAVPATAATPVSRRDPATVAIACLPES
ncbi:hypothetical protein [Kribbella amoyensis]|uniref:hypothetical protein n=1 Tax=Kribbella amoyensis TaxID=996641 RepID=UPI00119FADA1|nr:hypothetical protein [Kribbella amoyensis]